MFGGLSGKLKGAASGLFGGSKTPANEEYFFTLVGLYISLFSLLALTQYYIIQQEKKIQEIQDLNKKTWTLEES